MIYGLMVYGVKSLHKESPEPVDGNDWHWHFLTMVALGLLALIVALMLQLG